MTKKQLNIKLEELKKSGIVILKDLSKEIFDECEDLNSIIIRAYIPEYNDGEDITLQTNIHYPELSFNPNKNLSDLECSEISKEYKNIIYPRFGCFSDEFVVWLFGVNSEITITKNDINVANYNEDY